MTIETKYNLGDVVWHLNKYSGIITRLTLGQVTKTVTDTPGIGSLKLFDNFKEKHSEKETYMAVETGIGSGAFYYVEDLYATEEEAQAALTKEAIEAKKKEKMEQ